MRIQTWTSNDEQEEIHHFIDGTQTYLFGINEKLLGYETYVRIRDIVQQRLNVIHPQDAPKVGIQAHINVDGHDYMLVSDHYAALNKLSSTHEMSQRCEAAAEPEINIHTENVPK